MKLWLHWICRLVRPGASCLIQAASASVGSPVRLERDAVITCHLAQVPLQLSEKLLVAFSLIQRYEGVNVGKLPPGDGLRKERMAVEWFVSIHKSLDGSNWCPLSGGVKLYQGCQTYGPWAKPGPHEGQILPHVREIRYRNYERPKLQFVLAVGEHELVQHINTLNIYVLTYIHTRHKRYIWISPYLWITILF